LAWQHVAAKTQLRGRDGVLEVIRQLQGIELPAPAWEQHVLPARIRDYDPADLENLCLAGLIAWGRLRLNDDSQPSDDAGRLLKQRRRRCRADPHGADRFFVADELEFFSKALFLIGKRQRACPDGPGSGPLFGATGASFLADIARGTGLLKVKAEEALWQLVAHGFATGDGIAGLRVLLTPEIKRNGRRRPAGHQRRPGGGKNDAGGALVTMARAYLPATGRK
jgi:ATP-dependent Lhr-like helicase